MTRAALSFMFLLAATATGAQPAPPETAGAQVPHEPTTTSEIFVSKAMMAGMFEVEAGKLALSRSKNPAVRDFAQRMVTDHNAAGVELTRIAASKTYHLPVALLLDEDHQEKLKKLRRESDKAFDAAYAASMVQGHQDAVSIYSTAAAETLVDADLRAFASRVLPALQSHQELAKKLAASQER